ncbi:rhodanese-like domain-containing protein [Halpernia frigidisoli]|uniref:Rhodanese-related sulfurtransferase n=1 Tax=Halpernia frigidisoli TaxID=1125876 RepID=A0A1I3HSI4_9FLAO|nr:rhodanese-like domain-containing protein [Halpernia frigidisoli]SFI38569.1 Rhodanese-related sulfurtransferase [Halpernia frigidisoli]
MLDFFENLFGNNKVIFSDLMKSGAQIIDVRTEAEFSGGHIKNSTNIPLQNLSQNLNKLNKSKTIITCCASGMRSASAKSILEKNGFMDVHNGGGWKSLEQKIFQ